MNRDRTAEVAQVKGVVTAAEGGVSHLAVVSICFLANHHSIPPRKGEPPLGGKSFGYSPLTVRVGLSHEGVQLDSKGTALDIVGPDPEHDSLSCEVADLHENPFCDDII